MERLRPTTRPGDGAWRLPNGDAIYAEALHEATTTNFSPNEVHQMGLTQVAEISAELDKILKTQGYTQGSVGDRLAALNRTPAELYPDTRRGPRRAARKPQCRREGHVRTASARLRDAA